jgi:hypothetical protein
VQPRLRAWDKYYAFCVRAGIMYATQVLCGVLIAFEIIAIARLHLLGHTLHQVSRCMSLRIARCVIHASDGRAWSTHAWRGA